MTNGNDIRFGQLAMELKFASEEQVRIGLNRQASERSGQQQARCLGEIMIDLGFLTVPQRAMILEEQRRRTASTRIDKFELDYRLAVGGMSTIYRARNSETGQLVALKVLPLRYARNPAFLSRFQLEAKAGLSFNHPNIVRTLDVGCDGGIHFIVMELIEHGDLEQLIKELGRVPERRALEVMLMISSALQYAFEHGVVHRDIKPGNIMFARGNVAKLSDFGLVKFMDDHAGALTHEGSTLGTPYYIAPEQARGSKQIDIRADLYSLGATLYHCLCGTPPFTGSPLSVMNLHIVKDPPDPWSHNPGISRDTRRLLRWMLHKNPDYRPQTPQQLMERIRYIQSLAEVDGRDNVPTHCSSRQIDPAKTEHLSTEEVAQLQQQRTKRRKQPPKRGLLGQLFS